MQVSGLTRNRSGFLLVLLLLTSVTTRAFGANPSSGTLTDATPIVTYTGGPYTVPNVTDQANGQTGGTQFPTCDPLIPAMRHVHTDGQCSGVRRHDQADSNLDRLGAGDQR